MEYPGPPPSSLSPRIVQFRLSCLQLLSVSELEAKNRMVIGTTQVANQLKES